MSGEKNSCTLGHRVAWGLAIGGAGVAAGQDLSLNTATSCQNTGVVTVTIDMSAMPENVVGGQFFLLYDETVLDFVSAVPGDPPFTVELFESVNETSGTIEYAVVAPSGHPGTSVDSTLALLTFNVLADVCTPTADLVEWDLAHAPPSRLTNNLGGVVAATLVDLPAITIDGTDPLITPPANIAVNADAGGCDALVTVPALVAMDACSGINTITNDYTGTADASGTYPSGTTVVTWTVTDNCGNQSQVTQEVTVDPVNDLLVTVELQSVSATVTRCITIELWECPGGAPDAVVTEDLTFSGGIFSGTIEVPCGNYTCITARDTRHTLRRTDDDGDFAIAGTAYVADFSAAGTTDDSLTGGNLNDDFFIDILDFGIFTGQFGNMPGADTPCPALIPHADISGNGLVATEDFSFISANFLQAHEANCCGAPLTGGNGYGWNHAVAPGVAPRPGPLIQISAAELRRRGLDDLIAGDLNHDGWLDIFDIVALIEGQSP
jgi:hypothetical protein